MSGKELDSNRLLLEFSNKLRVLNREIINPVIQEVSLDDLDPVLRMVARARAAYLKELFDMANMHENQIPSPSEISQLNNLRSTYEELVAATQALETAIERGYLDVYR